MSKLSDYLPVCDEGGGGDPGVEEPIGVIIEVSAQLTNPDYVVLSTTAPTLLDAAEYPELEAVLPQTKMSTLFGNEEVMPNPGEVTDFLGTRIALSEDGSRAVAGNWGDGNRVGLLVVYVRVGDVWSIEQTIPNPAAVPANADKFGFDFDIDGLGERIVVGSPGNSDVAAGYGRTFVYARVGSVWSLEASLDKQTLDASYNEYGNTARITADGTRLIVGDSQHAIRYGLVEIWLRTGTSWTFEQALLGSDVGAAQNSYFGLGGDISPDGTTIAVSMYGLAKAFVYDRVDVTWTLYGELIGDAGRFGGEQNVAVANNKVVVVGNKDWSGLANTASTGHVAAFTRVDGAYIRTFDSPTSGSNDHLGRQVGIAADGSKLVYGTYGNDEVMSYFAVHDSFGSKWYFEKQFKSTDPSVNQFGWGAAISDDGKYIFGGDNYSRKYGTTWGSITSFNSFGDVLIITAVDTSEKAMRVR